MISHCSECSNQTSFSGLNHLFSVVNQYMGSFGLQKVLYYCTASCKLVGGTGLV